MPSASRDEERILQEIDRSEVADLAVALGNIASPSGDEIEMADYLETWLKDAGLAPFRQHAAPGRDNVIAVLNGSGGGGEGGGGRSLLFNSHMDTQVPDPFDPGLPAEGQGLEKRAWLEDGKVFGIGVVNDKGPMAAFLVAATALRKSGIKLRGDVILTMVVGEIGTAPVDEFQGPRYLGNGFGSKHLVDQGVRADFSLVAEATHFGVTWAEAGVLYVKLTVRGERRYAPFVDNAPPPRDSAHSVLKAADLIRGIQEWAVEYEEKNSIDLACGRMVPKVNIGAVRAGRPYDPSCSPPACHLYVDIRLTPDGDPAQIVEELETVSRKRGTPAEAHVFLHEPGSVATNIEPLRDALESAHGRILGKKLEGVAPPETSMWRDLNVFNRAGIPSLTYGPGAPTGGGMKYLSVEDLERAARVYALTAYYTCREAS